jgi:hypothetical protein
MMKRQLLTGLIIGLTMVGSAQAAEVTGFRSARFGGNEKVTIAAAMSDLEVKAGDILRAQDSVTKVTTLTAKVKNFRPLNVPASVTYVLGYKCNCLTQVSIAWNLPEGITPEQRKTTMVGVTALSNRFAGENWGKDETIANRVIGDVKEGSENAIIFFRGQNKTGGAVTLAGAPVKMVKVGAKDGKIDAPLSANIDGLKNISLNYEKDAVNPDIYRVDVTGF